MAAALGADVRFPPIADIDGWMQSAQMRLLPWLFCTLLCACSPASRVVTTTRVDDAVFRSAYALFVGASAHRCTFWLTDVGITKPRDVTDSLVENGYDSKRGMEVLSDPDTPPQCIMVAEKAVRRAGFVSVRAHLASDKDRMKGIP